MTQSAYKQKFGTTGEDRAAEFLTGMGFTILNRNFRYGKKGEIDIIARKGDLLVFAEVKSRSSAAYGGAKFSISKRKQATLKFVADRFLLKNPELNNRDITCRFDLIAVENNSIELVEDIIR